MKLPLSSLFNRSRRNLLLAGVLAAVTFTLPVSTALAQNGRNWSAEQWVGTWGTGTAGPPLPAALQTFTDQTVRLIVHTSIGGAQVRIRVSNELGSTPLVIGSAHVALRQSGADIVTGTDRVLTFSGMTSITIPAGAPALSDPVDLDVPALADLAISMHLPGTVQATTIHSLAFQTNYVSLPGDFTDAASLPTQRTITSWPFLTEVDVQSTGRAGAIVALGDSITDGVVTTLNANRRWTDVLAQRLLTTRGPFLTHQTRQSQLQSARNGVLGVVNRGISGDRLLRDPGTEPLFGQAALTRFDRDVLATAGVEYLVVLIGINDIGHPGTSAPGEPEITAEQIIAGYRQLIARAHIKGITVYGATLTPFEGTVFPGYFTQARELIRREVNNWIRSSDEFDAVIDFDRAVRDPSHPSRMLPAYDAGDHLHPNDLGMTAMGNAVPLELFSARGTASLNKAGK